MDQLTEKDLDLILVSVSGLEDSTIEHKANAMKFYQRAKLRVKQQDPYYPNAHDMFLIDTWTKLRGVEVEVERLGQLKASGMKEIDFKKQAEVEETLAYAHIETDTDVATETIMTKGHVDRKW
ncbi:microtubule-associated protein 1-like, partial [Trifolium medium]|nr:microtubule-associated protein 1-like [Trifolium medium]